MFKILDYLQKLEIVRETPTHITSICPVCGDDNFKIVKTGKSKNAYKCWSNYCSANEIKEKLGYKPGLLEPKKTRPELRIKPSKIPFRGKQLATVDNYPPIKVRVKSFSGGYRTEERVYPYSSTQRVLRIDNIQSKTKYVYIQYQNEDFTWISGTGENFWNPYTFGIEESLRNPFFDTALFVEGEKTAEFCKERGLSAVTLMAGNFHKGLDKSILVFSLKFPNIKNIIYVPDADTPGEVKAEKLKESCWKVGLGCEIIPMSDIINDPFEGMDLADLNESLFKKFKNDIISSTLRRDPINFAPV